MCKKWVKWAIFWDIVDQKEHSDCHHSSESMINECQKQFGSESSFTASHVVKKSGKVQSGFNKYWFLRASTIFDHFWAELGDWKVRRKLDATSYNPEEEIPDLLISCLTVRLCKFNLDDVFLGPPFFGEKSWFTILVPTGDQKRSHKCQWWRSSRLNTFDCEIGRAHVWTPVTS